jgi:hypothetical protein
MLCDLNPGWQELMPMKSKLKDQMKTSLAEQMKSRKVL